MEPKASGKLAGKTFTIPLAASEAQVVKSERSPSPSKDTSDKKKKKHKKHRKHKKHKSKGKDRQKDRKGNSDHDDEADSSDDDSLNGRPDNSIVTRQLEHGGASGASVDQVLRHNGSTNLDHGNVTMHSDDSRGRDGFVHASKTKKVDTDRPTPTMPTVDTAHASSQPDSCTGTAGIGQGVKKSRALFGMAMGAVLRPGTLPGVKPKKK